MTSDPGWLSLNGTILDINPSLLLYPTTLLYNHHRQYSICNGQQEHTKLFWVRQKVFVKDLCFNTAGDNACASIRLFVILQSLIFAGKEGLGVEIKWIFHGVSVFLPFHACDVMKRTERPVLWLFEFENVDISCLGRHKKGFADEDSFWDCDVYELFYFYLYFPLSPPPRLVLTRNTVLESPFNVRKSHCEVNWKTPVLEKHCLFCTKFWQF